jgi:hypothetical protein
MVERAFVVDRVAPAADDGQQLVAAPSFDRAK